MAASAVLVALIQGKNSSERVRLEDRVKRLERRLIDKHREDPDDVEDI